MNTFLAEFIGTAILILLGNGVVANVVLQQTKGHNSGLIVIAFGWAIAVFVPVFMVGSFSGAHLNPAVTVGFLVKGAISMEKTTLYLGGQLLGAALGSALVWLYYKPHIDITKDADAKLAIFCTSPAIRNRGQNFFSEVMATFVLVFAILFITAASINGKPASLGALDALPVGLLVLGIGLSLGGTTGYAINPARDLIPRLMHTLLPIPEKGSSDWGYAWIPVVGPILGGILAALAHNAIVG